MNLFDTILRRVASVARNESGAAMTEFVIGLPVFILIFSGMGMLYRMNEEALQVKAEANRVMWADAEVDMNVAGAVPIIGAATSITSLGDVMQNGASALGIYADSGVKTQIPVRIVPGAGPNPPCLTVQCALANDDNTLFSRKLLNDNSVDGMVNGGLNFGDGPSALSSILDIAGARPAIAAGIRYNTVEGEAEDRTFQTKFAGGITDHTFQPGKLDMPATTVPTHRIMGIVLTRAEIATDSVYDDQIPNFNDSFDFDSSTTGAGDECAAAMQAVNTCAENGPDGESRGAQRRRCGDPEEIAENNGCGDLQGDGHFGTVSGSCTFPGC